MKIGVIGLGSMGYGIATSLLRSGHQVYGADVNPEAVRRLRAEGGSDSRHHVRCCRSLDALAIVVLNADPRPKMCCSESAGLVARLSPGAVVIMCVTVAPEYARSAAERCAARGIYFLDAPISGGSVKAAEGKLSIMASGTPEAFGQRGQLSRQWPKRFSNSETTPVQGPP